MASRPPDPPSPAGTVADLWRRGRLTLRHHGPRELALRLLLAPLRPTPLGRRMGYGRRYGTVEAQAREWYRLNRRPVTVVIPSFGDPALAIQAARSVRSTTHRSTRVVVVDDGSALEHQAALRELKGVTALLGRENGGFAVAANAGIRAARAGDDVVVLNSDVIAEPHWLERLQHSARHPMPAGIAGPKLLYPDRRVQSAGSFRNRDAPQWFDHRYRFREARFGPANIAARVLGVTGACLYITRECLEEIGPFDEAFGMAYEDMDLCLRAWEAGWEVRYAPRSELFHLESQTRPVEPGERELAAQGNFWRRWGPWFDERSVGGEDGTLRIVYVTEDTGVGGGHRDVFEHLNRLVERGHDAQLWTLAPAPDWFELGAPVRKFPDYHELVRALAPLEALKVATWWNTGVPVWLASLRRGRPVFFVQDIETSYYPDSPEMQEHVLAGYREEFSYLTISRWNQERLAELGHRAELVPPGIDLTTFRPLPDAVRSPDRILALGRTNPLKNLPLTLAAWRALGPEPPPLQLFGIEPELGARHGAQYVQQPSDEQVNRLLNECAVFVQTSTHEGFALPPLEAMATGAAVVCTDAHGNREFCLDGVNCLMPDPDPASVANAIRRVLEDPELARRLGRAGIATAADYAWERRIDELEGHLRRIAAGGVVSAARAHG